MIVFFVQYAKVTIDIMKTIISTSKIKHIIIVHEKSLTPDAKQAISTNKLFLFEIFSFDEMSYDPISIVPPHSVLDEALRPKEWKKLPIILTTDIIARYYNFKRGSVIKVEDEGVLSYLKCV